LDYPRRAPKLQRLKSKIELQMALNQGFQPLLANATTKEGKVNFEGIEVPVM
jgi:hypothetical protein